LLHGLLSGLLAESPPGFPGSGGHFFDKAGLEFEFSAVAFLKFIMLGFTGCVEIEGGIFNFKVSAGYEVISFIFEG